MAQSNPTLHPIKMSVTDQAAYEQVVETVGEVVGEDGLNLLINNAGVLPQNRDLQVRYYMDKLELSIIQCSQAVTPQDMRDAFETNCIAPLFLSRALLPLIQKAATKNGDAAMGVAKAAIVQVRFKASEIVCKIVSARCPQQWQVLLRTLVVVPMPTGAPSQPSTCP